MSAVPRLTIVLLAPVPVQIGKRHQHNEQKYRSQCHNWAILIATKMYEARNTYAADGSNLRSRPAELPRPSGLADRPGGQSVLSLLYCRSRLSTRVTDTSRGSKSRTGTDTAPGSWPVRSRSPGSSAFARSGHYRCSLSPENQLKSFRTSESCSKDSQWKPH